MAWIRCDLRIWRHWKTRRLARSLGISEFMAASHVLRFWSWTAEMAPTGDLSRLSNEEIAWGAEWAGDPEAFVKGLIEANWIDQNEDGSTMVHEWLEGPGLYFTEKEDTARRVRKHRAKKKEVAMEAGTGSTGNAPVTVTCNDVTECNALDKIRGEENISPPTPPKGARAPSKPKKVTDPSKNLAPLIDAFAAKKLEFPAPLTDREAGCANKLREAFTDEELAQLFYDVRHRRYGDAFARVRMSFSYALDKDFAHNWRCWVRDGRPRMGLRDNQDTVAEPPTMEALKARASRKGVAAHA